MKIVQKSGKTIDEAVNEALKELNVSRDEVEIEVVNEGKRGILGLGSEDAVVRVKIEDTPLSRAQEYMEDILEKLGIEAEIKGSFEDETVNIEVVGESESVGRIIGRRGDTLDDGDVGIFFEIDKSFFIQNQSI